MMDFAKSRNNMVDCQIETAGVISPLILEQFGSVPREKFVPQNLSNVAYVDEDVFLGNDRYLLNPVMHARMIEALAPKQSDIVLDIGGATGYSAAILSRMVTTIIALEQDEGYLTQAEKIWQELDLCNIASVQGVLNEGVFKTAPYDLILMNGTVSEIPEKLVEQLSESGRLIAIVKPDPDKIGYLTIVEKLVDKDFSSYTISEAGGHYIPGFEPKTGFVF